MKLPRSAGSDDLETLRIIRHGDYEGLELRFAGEKHDPLILQTKPEIKLSWDITPLGTR
jgi:hypothetical protein